MSDAFTHAAEALELADVLAHVAAKCTNATAAESIRELRPVASQASIESSLVEIGELVDYQEARGRLPVADTSVKDAIRLAAERGDAIDARRFLDVAAMERVAADVVHGLEQVEGFERLRSIADGLAPQSALVKDIERCIDRDGSIKDEASKQLATLRRRVLKAREGVRRFTDKLAKSFGSIEYATYNGARYMLVVPREKCKRNDGIVHSTSHSGGSLYFEPLSLVEQNNNLETIMLDVRAEEARILAELTARVVASADLLLDNARILDRLDALDAKARFARDFRCVRPALSPEGRVRLVDARHPLLELSLREADGTDVLVPLEVDLQPGDRVLVITGPNAGGKTVTLKTIGLLVLMTQCGLPVPCAEGSEVAIFDRVFADIGDEQSIATSLSTFTSHLRHLDDMCRNAGVSSLCLIDEIGDGTDPDEGAALAIAALEQLLRARAAVVATTHYGKVKTFALEADGVSNASMLFDDGDGRPLYRLMQGTAGRSRGIDTARRLRFVSSVVERAQVLVGEESFRLETLLGELEAGRLALERDQAEAAERSGALERLVEAYESRERELRDQRAAHEAKARREAEDILVRARREIEAIVKSIRESQASKAVVKEGHERLGRLLDEVRDAQAVPADQPRVDTVAVGQRVSLNASGDPIGTVVAVRKDKVAVDIRGMTVNVPVEKLYRVDEEVPTLERSVNIDVDVEPLASTALDVRGQDRGQALEAVDRLIDGAVLNGVREVTVIHGLGEEVLLASIRTHLQGDGRVRSFREGRHGEGGRGVTVVSLK